MSDNTSNNKRIAKNTLLLYMRMFLLMGITLYTSRVVLNTLGVAGYGVYNVVGGFVAMFGIIIEKRIVSHYFTAGGYSFADAATYCQYYQRLQGQPGLYLSHIVYAMLLEGHTFRPVVAREYEDFEFGYERK